MTLVMAGTRALWAIALAAAPSHFVGAALLPMGGDLAQTRLADVITVSAPVIADASVVWAFAPPDSDLAQPAAPIAPRGLGLMTASASSFAGTAPNNGAFQARDAAPDDGGAAIRVSAGTDAGRESQTRAIIAYAEEDTAGATWFDHHLLISGALITNGPPTGAYGVVNAATRVARPAACPSSGEANPPNASGPIIQTCDLRIPEPGLLFATMFATLAALLAIKRNPL